MYCPICRDIFTNKLTLECTHEFCYKCIYEWHITHKQKFCPVCRQIFDLNMHKYKNRRITRSMSRTKRNAIVVNQIELYMKEWADIQNRRRFSWDHTKSPYTKLGIIINKICHYLYSNIWWLQIRKDNTLAIKKFREVFFEKLDYWEMGGIKEASIWKYKFKSSLNLDG